MGTVNDPTIPPLPGPVIEQVPVIGEGVFTEIVQKTSKELKPEPLTLTKNPGPADVGETETVGGGTATADARGSKVETAKNTMDSNASTSTSDSFLRLLVNSRILQSYVTLSERVT